MVKRSAHFLIALCFAECALANDDGDVRRLLSGRKTFSVKDDFGARGDGHDDTDAIQNAFDALKKEKSSELTFPKGKYKCGPIQMSGLKDARIQFEKGAELHMGDKGMWKAHNNADGHTSWFTGEDCNSLEITGGNFYGDRDAWPKNDHGDKRPNVFSFGKMKDFEIHDLSIWSSPSSHISVHSSDGVKIHDIHIETEIQSDNTEGVTLGDVKHAHISHVNVTDGDDCLKVHGVSSDILFEKCTCTGGHGLSIGGDGSDNRVQDIKYHDIHLYGMSNGARLKITPAATGFVKNITWEKIRMENVRAPMHINTAKEGGSKEGSNQFEIGDLYYTDIVAKYDKKHEVGSGRFSPAQLGWFICDSKHPCKKLHLTDITIETDDEGDGWKCEGDNVHATVHNVSPRWSNSCRDNFQNGEDEDVTQEVFAV